MVVNSIPFLLFFVVVFSAYYLPILKATPKYQNIILLVASYLFYGYIDFRMIPLLLGATVVFYLLGSWLKREMERENWKAASYITTFGVVLGVGVLLYFKYLNFFIDSFARLLTTIGLSVSWTTLNIVLPVGVSFFTFKLISYVIEIHRERIIPSKEFLDFAVYVAFFPTILSGPIDRPNQFLPQLQKVRNFDYDLAISGCQQILWGMFTKMCVADNLALLTDNAWNRIPDQSALYLLVVALLYPIQMYADFDGYSNMAIGVSKILGIKVTRNFNHPLLARTTAEYWRRWHMSLTSWITDYIFMPLNISFRNIGKWGTIFAAIINLVVIGLWHGANWTYGLFGLYHGLLFIPLVLSGSFGKNKKIKENKYSLPFMNDVLKMVLTYSLVAIGLVIFRADSIQSLCDYIRALFDNSFMPFNMGHSVSSWSSFVLTLILSFLIVILDWVSRKSEFALYTPSFINNRPKKILFYAIIFIFINLTANLNSSQFIYFQF